MNVSIWENTLRRWSLFYFTVLKILFVCNLWLLALRFLGTITKLIDNVKNNIAIR